MKDQHEKITGYRDLSQYEIDLMNEGKKLAEQVGAYCDKIKMLGSPDKSDPLNLRFEFDLRWLAIGVTDLQKGFMSVIRSIARPTTF